MVYLIVFFFFTNIGRQSLKLTEVTVSDQLEGFRASKEVELTEQLSIYLDKLFLEKKFAQEKKVVLPKILASGIGSGE